MSVEELAQDAKVIALERWPADGVPDNPGAWLVTTARRRAMLGDAIVGRVVLADDSTVTIVLDVDYRFVPQTQ